jgi:Domain of unknown function (DUF4388)
MDVAAELTALAGRAATGQLTVGDGQLSIHILLRDGRVCTIEPSTARPALGMRLVSGGCVSLTHLGAALSMQQQHPHMRLGDVLVRMGLVQRQEVEAVAWEQMCDDMAAMLRWKDPVTGFEDLGPDAVPAPGPTVEALLTAAAGRDQRWQEIVRQIGGADTVPSLSDDMMGAKDRALRPTDWAVLCRVDGQRSLRSIASQAGFTTFEAASILLGLIAGGLVTVPVAHLPTAEDRPRPWPAAASPASAPPAPPSARVAPAPPPPVTPAPQPAAAPVVVDQFDDPADLLRELSQLSGGLDAASRRRGR